MKFFSSILILIACLYGLPFSYGQVVDLSSGLVAHYPLDGNTNDVSGNGNNGIGTDLTLRADRWGVADLAYDFVQPTSNITVTSNASLQNSSFSYNIWLPFSGLGTDNVLRIQNSIQIFRTWPSSGVIEFFHVRITDVNDVDTDYTVGQLFVSGPQMLTVTYDNSSMIFKFYIDGDLKTSEVLPEAPQTNASDLVFGTGRIGGLDEIRIYNRALNEAEVEELFKDIIFPDFEILSPPAVVDEVVQFNDLSTSDSPITSWSWDFEDDNIIDATSQNPSTTYSETGFYNVELTVSDGTNTRAITRTGGVAVQEANPPSTIVEAEYFFDDDPGIGGGFEITGLTPGNAIDLQFTADATGLSPGFHKLFVRVKESPGGWSLYEGRTFYIQPGESIVSTEVTAAEYFFDSDPGNGSGEPISLGITGAEIEKTFTADANGLVPGFHKLFVRVKDDRGLWSLFEGRTFYIQPLSAATGAPITAYEYFIGSDPGVGNGTVVSVSSTTELDQTIMIDLSGSGLTDGDYTLSIRVKDENGLWSLFETREFTICATAETYYADTDGDGFGDPDVSLVACEQPVGYVDNDDDCDDTDENITNEGITWYLDDDGDGYGDSETSLDACEQPVGYVDNAEDCDDTDENINPDLVWYEDVDGDGFGDGSSTTTACEQPLGYVSDDTDCDDTNGNINPGETDVAGSGIDANCDGQYLWFVDGDSDTYGSASTTSSSNSTPGAGESASNDDCNDGDASVNPGEIDQPGSGIDANCDGMYTWYTDGDGDGFAGSGTGISVNSTPGAGEFAASDDCDDSNPDINPGETDVAGSGIDANCDGQYLWFVDGDTDTYGSASTTSSSNSTPGTGESASDDDCDDGDASVNPGEVDQPGSGIDANCDGMYTWYTDGDGDGYAGSGTVESPNSSPGSGEFATNEDCEDNDAAINPETIWYADTDGDGYGNISSTQANCLQPSGFVSNSTDCDDTDALITTETTWYADTDGDGFGDLATSQSACSQPTGYVSNSSDCDDSSASITTETTWYVDADGDGFGDPSSNLSACTQPTGFVSDNTDCDDADALINPQTIWYSDTDGDGFGDATISRISCIQPTGFVSNNTDCNDADGLINPQTIWYTDADGDGFGDVTASQQACTKPSGSVSNSTDCDDTDALINPNTPWYADVDGDGFGDANITVDSCTQPTGFVSDSSDCDDENAAVYPGAPALADGLDNDCDGTVDKIDQTINMDPIPDQLDEGGSLQVVVTISSGLTPSLEVTGPATLEDGELTLIGAGLVTITASQPGNDGYAAAESVTISFCVNPVPEISIATDNVAVLVIESNYDTGNQWYLDGSALSGETNQQHLVAATGEYTVQVDIDGCVGESEVFNAVLTNVSPEEAITTTLFPNPVHQMLRLQISNLDNRMESEVFVIDINGSILLKDKMVRQSSLKSLELDLSGLSNGSYFLMIKTGDQVIRERFAKQ